MVNKLNKELDLSSHPELIDMHEHVSIIIERSKSKINNTFAEHIDVCDREGLLLGQTYIKNLTLDELNKNYIDYIDILVRQNLFSSSELLDLFDKILINLIEKKSEK